MVCVKRLGTNAVTTNQIDFLCRRTNGVRSNQAGSDTRVQVPTRLSYVTQVVSDHFISARSAAITEQPTCATSEQGRCLQIKGVIPLSLSRTKHTDSD